MPSKSDRKNSGPKEKIDAFHINCRKVGLRITPQRTAIYKTLLESSEHPSVEMVFRKVREVFPCISLDTVNRTLLTLSEMDAASVVEGSGNAKRFDGNLDSHQHFKCIKCERIIDFYHKPFDNISVPKSLGRKLIILRKTVYFEGICDLCAKKSKGYQGLGFSSLRKNSLGVRSRH